MDEPTTSPQPEPNVTLPLSIFLEILWGYKKGVELKERAVPGKEVIALLEALPNASTYYHIQKNPEGEDTVWQKEFWRNAGEREVARDNALATLWKGIDHILDKIQPSFPMFNREQLRTFASDMITGEKWETLEGLGIDCSSFKDKTKLPPK